MRIRRTRWGLLLVAVGVSCLVLLCSQTVQAQVKLEYKYPEGTKLTYKSTSKTEQTLSLMGMGIETKQNATVVRSRSVGKKRADSTLPIEEKVESLRVELSFPGGNLVYDSTDPNVKIDNPALSFLGDVFKLTSQVAVTFVVDDHNKVKAVEGTEKLIEKADKLDAMAKETIRGSLDPDKLKAKFAQEHASMPDVLARTGEPWERTELLEEGGQVFTFRKKYEYVGTEKRGAKTLDKISSKATAVDLKQDPESKSPFKIAKSDLKIESSEGTTLFDREVGCVVDAKGKTRIKGSLTLSANGQELPGDIDLTLESHTELQPAAK
jgi:Family of unknown function (DUF6263)